MIIQCSLDLRRPQTDRASEMVYSESNSNITNFKSLSLGVLLKDLLTIVLVFLLGLPILSVFFYGCRDPGGFLKNLLTNVLIFIQGLPILSAFLYGC